MASGGGVRNHRAGGWNCCCEMPRLEWTLFFSKQRRSEAQIGRGTFFRGEKGGGQEMSAKKKKKRGASRADHRSIDRLHVECLNGEERATERPSKLVEQRIIGEGMKFKSIDHNV